MAEQLAIAGGSPVKSDAYPAWPYFDAKDEAILLEVLRSGVWGGYPEPGKYNARFCETFAAYQNGGKAGANGILMVNGTVTMEVALKALGIGWGDEVIIPALTFAATGYAPIAAGALPVVVDVEPEAWTIDPKAVEAAITPRTKAIMPVHCGQVVSDMDAIVAIARKHGLAIVEDCAHSQGKEWGGQGVGLIGDFGSFSHQSSKILTAGEGGTLLTKDATLARRAHSLIDCGRAKDDAGKEFTFGANFRLGELHAALLNTQMDRFEAQRAERETNGRYMEEQLAKVKGVRALKVFDRVTRLSFYRFIIAIDPDAYGNVGNAAVCEALDAEGIGCWVGYESMSDYELFQPHLSRMPVPMQYAKQMDPKSWHTPVADRAAKHEQIYLDENIFRAGKEGIDQAVEALLKLQRHPDVLKKVAATMAAG